MTAATTPTWVLLLLAVAGEVLGTASLRLSDGLTRPVFAVGVVACYGASIAVFGQVLDRGTELGVAYGTLTGTGLAAATLLSVAVFGDALGDLQVAGIAVLGVGVWLLQQEPA